MTKFIVTYNFIHTARVSQKEIDYVASPAIRNDLNIIITRRN